VLNKYNNLVLYDYFISKGYFMYKIILSVVLVGMVFSGCVGIKSDKKSMQLNKGNHASETTCITNKKQNKK